MKLLNFSTDHHKTSETFKFQYITYQSHYDILLWLNSHASFKLFHGLKCISKPRECVVLCDFAKNHSFVCETKFTYHPHNAEPSIQPFAIYFEVYISDAVTHENVAVFSDYLKHINLFQ